MKCKKQFKHSNYVTLSRFHRTTVNNSGFSYIFHGFLHFLEQTSVSFLSLYLFPVFLATQTSIFFLISIFIFAFKSPATKLDAKYLFPYSQPVLKGALFSPIFPNLLIPKKQNIFSVFYINFTLKIHKKVFLYTFTHVKLHIFKKFGKYSTFIFLYKIC